MKPALHGAWIAAVVAVTCAGDLLLKHVYFDAFVSQTGKGFFFFGGLVQQVIHRNYGITANFPLPTWLTVIVTLATMAFVGILARFSIQDKSYLRAFFLAVLLGGAAGNLFDRVTLGFVRDWVLLGERSAMNFADFSILIGIIGAYFSPAQATATPTPQTPQTT